MSQAVDDAKLEQLTGETRLRDVFEQVGCKRFWRAAETPLNPVLEAKR